MLSLSLFFSCLVFPPSLIAGDDRISSAPGQYVWIGEYRLHIHCMGDGSPTVVLDAGLGGHSLYWSRVQPRVAEFTRVCSYDRAGYGWSDRGPAPRTSERITRELSKLLGLAGVAAPYVLVGHSFGGFTARLFAASYPERTAGLVLVDSSHEAQFERLEQAGIGRAVAPTGQSFVIGNHYEIPTALPESLRALARALALRPNAVRSLYSELGHMRLSAHQVRHKNSLPDVPLFVIAHDSRSTARTPRNRKKADLWLEMQRELASRTRQARFVLADGSGHYVQLDQPDIVIDAIRSVVEMSRQPVNCDEKAISYSC